MKILIIDNSLAFTGAFKCALNEAELLSGEHEFVFVLHDDSNLKKPLEEKGFKVYTLHMVEIKKSLPVLLLYPLMLLKNTIELLRIVKHEQVEVVQMNDFYNLLGAMIKKFGYKGKLITYVRFLPSAMPSILRKWWTKLAQKYSNKVITVSDAVLNQLPANENTIRIYDPVKLTETLPEKEVMQNGIINILYLGNYIKGKGQDHALLAFAKAHQQQPKLRLKYVGGDMGLEKNKHFKQELKEQAQVMGISEVVSFAPFNKNVEEEIKQADIMLNFSEAESFSMTCLEAAYYGTPLIATRCGGPEEIIEHGRTGLLVAKQDIHEMSDAILALANDKIRRSEYAKAGKKYVRDKFNINNFEQQFKTVLAEA